MRDAGYGMRDARYGMRDIGYGLIKNPLLGREDFRKKRPLIRLLLNSFLCTVCDGLDLRFGSIGSGADIGINFGSQ